MKTETVHGGNWEPNLELNKKGKWVVTAGQ